MAWNNDDGLYVKFGTEKATAAVGGELAFLESDMHVTQIELADMSALASSAAIQDDTVTIPAGAFISKVELLVDTACTGTSSTLDVGWIDAVDRTSNADDDAFIVAGALATMDAAGDIVTYTQGSTAHGAGIGTTLSTTKLVTVNYGTAFTAGAVRIKIYWYIP